jgi:hypothetical protein
MELEGLDVVKFLNGPETVRDGSLVSLSVERLAAEPVIELTFEVRRQSAAHVVRIELRDVREFEYGYSKDNSPLVVEFLKCLMTAEGEFYLSLDPYDEREDFVSADDNDFFRSGRVKLTRRDSAQPSSI